MGGKFLLRAARIAALITTIPSPAVNMEKLGQPFVPARCSMKGVSTSSVPTADNPATTHSTGCPRSPGFGDLGSEDARDPNSARTRSQIIGYAKKNGAPTRKCHQLPWFPGTFSVTAFHADVLYANGKNGSTPAPSHTSNIATFTQTGPSSPAGARRAVPALDCSFKFDLQDHYGAPSANVPPAAPISGLPQCYRS